MSNDNLALMIRAAVHDLREAGFSYDEGMIMLEREWLLQALEANDHDIGLTAIELDMEPDALRDRLRMMGVQNPERERPRERWSA
jgi:DNA-binding NtrC family response regulator